MYIKNIAIKNIGPISELNVELPFDEKGSPKPVIFVGENGSGKTILQSQITDAFYEIGSSLFEDVGKKDGMKRYYYKLAGALNLQSGKDKGFCILKLIDNENSTIEYLDKIGRIEKSELTSLVQAFSLDPNNDSDSQKRVTQLSNATKKLQKEWSSGAYFYQPAYRYEEPFWKNRAFVDQSRFEDNKNYANYLDREIEILSSINNNKAYIKDLVLDFEQARSSMYQARLEDISIKISKGNALSISDVRPGQILHDQVLWHNINDILKKIKQREDIRFGIGQRGTIDRVSIVELNKGLPLYSIDNLSLGELVLLNLFVNIIRHGDNPRKLLDQICGIVVIDEIDVHLHANLQFAVLPELIKMFPKVQFIITSHSPLFLLGMKKIFGEENFEIRNMPNGEIITAERFSEFEEAYDILKKTETFAKEINRLVENSKKPILFVEGDYDIKYINRAAEHLDKKNVLLQIEIYDGGGFGGLDKIWKNYDSKISSVIPQKILLLYDCDTGKGDSDKGKVFKRIIPSLEESKCVIEKGIENLFERAVLDRAIKAKKAFIDIDYERKCSSRGQEITVPEKWGVCKAEKGNLCDWICKDGNGTKDDFKNFETIFEIIENVLCQK
ncbi:MAG: AAA family ATPase [Gammaproteobacteria bacterium]|nr:AAA family ATPase [Gammaproteobacteria bacterium]